VAKATERLTVMGVYFDGAIKMAECDCCGKKFKYTGWNNFGKKYCCTKCRNEAEASEADKEAKESAREEEYESGGGSSSSSSGSGFANSIMGNVIAGVVLILLLIIVIGVIFSKNEDANDPAVKMAKWEEHLEKRRAAFAEGLSEEGIEERGLKNFTWEEWQNRSKAKVAEKPAEKVDDGSIRELWYAHQKKRRDYINAGHSGKDADKVGLYDLGFDEFKKNYKNIKYKTPEEIQQVEAEAKARAEAEAQAKAESESERRADSLARKEAEAKARAEASARAKAEAENKRLAEKLARKEAEEKARAREQARAKMAAEARAKAEAESKRHAEMQARKNAEEKARAEAEARAKVKAEADAKPMVSAESGAAASGQQDGVSHKPSKDSSGIAISVEGKGKTKDAALRSAIRKAVFRTVGTWVGSKSRMEDSRDAVNAQMATVTEDDVRKYEVLETQQQDGGLVLKVKVYVSKKKIAPKFATIFPDVFGND